MTELIIFGAAFLVVFTGIVIGSKCLGKKKASQSAKVELVPGSVKVQWNGHRIEFTFIQIDGQWYYSGAIGDKGYSCSITSTTDKKLPWKLWAKYGEDEITILTDIHNTYEIV